MTDKKPDSPTKNSGRRQLKDERATLQSRVDELKSSDRGPVVSPETRQQITELEERIGEIDEKLDRIELARELERQQDA